MKILLITDNHSPLGGGAEKQFFTLKKLLKNHPDITVFSLGFGSKAMSGNDFIVLKETQSKALRQLWRMFVNPAKYWQLRRVIKKINPDVIHLHNIKKYTPALLKAVYGYPTLQTVHDFSPICPTQWNVHKDLQPCKAGFSLQCFWQHRRNYSFISYLALLFSFFRMRRLLKKSVGQFIAPSPFLADYLIKNNFQHVIYLPPFQDKVSSPQQKKMPANHFLYLGQLEKQKGIDILLYEFYQATQKNSEISLTIAGSGSQAKALQEKVHEWHLENKVYFVGWHKNPIELYAACTAVLFPSIGLESFGLVMTEAMAQARPVIGSNRGPTSWLVEHEKTGLLFDPLQEGDLAAKILELSGDDPVLAQTLGKNAFEKLKDFPINAKILEQMIDIVGNLA